jgi:hypothetical protein
VLFRFVTLILLKEREINFNGEEIVLALRDVSTRGVSTARPRSLDFLLFLFLLLLLLRCCYCCVVAIVTIAQAIFDNGVVDCFGNSYILGSDRRIDLTSRENVVSNDFLG